MEYGICYFIAAIFTSTLLNAFLFIYIYQQLKTIYMTQAELLQGLKDVNAGLTKVKEEYTTSITRLEKIITDQNSMSAEIEAELGTLKNITTSLDAITPDAPTEPVEPPIEQ